MLGTCPTSKTLKAIATGEIKKWSRLMKNINLVSLLCKISLVCVFIMLTKIPYNSYQTAMHKPVPNKRFMPQQKQVFDRSKKLKHPHEHKV